MMGGGMMNLLISQNTVKHTGYDVHINAGMVRYNTAWYTQEELVEKLAKTNRPRFVDVHSDRKKAKVAKHDYKTLLQYLGSIGVEWVAISKVENIDTIREARECVANPKTRICAKVESIAGYNILNGIMATADGVMVDSEDLATEVGWEKSIELSEEMYKRMMGRRYPYFRLKGVIFEYDNVKTDKVVYTYGVFDMLHPGHVTLLEKAKAAGTRLIVGVVKDDAVREKKGKDRPIQPFAVRAEMLSKLKCVDEVWEQDTFDPVPNMVQLDPDILVKGNDWSYPAGDEWIKDNGKILIRPEYTVGYSTTEMIKKIREEVQ
jgi:rfaE bifunctional protein nucleotidyltransferase chain/domain